MLPWPKIVAQILDLDKVVRPGPWEVSFSQNGGYDCMTDAYRAGPITLDLSEFGQKHCDYDEKENSEPATRAKREATFLSLARTEFPRLAVRMQELEREFINAARLNHQHHPAGDLENCGSDVCQRAAAIVASYKQTDPS